MNELSYNARHLNDGRIEPVFIIGSYRSGTSVLTWALGQHANIFPLEETNWIYKQALYLDTLYSLGTANGSHSHLASLGMTRLAFYRSYGKQINSFILEHRIDYLRTALKAHLTKNNLPVPRLKELKNIADFAGYANDNDPISIMRNPSDTKNRWIDGTPENSHFVYALNLLFPHAKFIFLIRNPIRVAHSLMNFATVDGATENREEQQAYDQWYSLTESCYLALKALGSAKVLLIKQEDLIAQKEQVIQQCLSFIQEDFDSNCLKPLQVILNSSQFDKSGIDFSIENGLQSEKVYVQNSCLFYNQIISDSPYTQKGSLHYYRFLRNRYLENARCFY